MLHRRPLPRSVGVAHEDDLAKGRASMLGEISVKSVAFALIVAAVLAAEELVKGVVGGLGWAESLARLVENAASGRRLVARFSYLTVLFWVYYFLFAIDRYFIGATVGEIVRSKFRRPRFSSRVASASSATGSHRRAHRKRPAAFTAIFTPTRC